MCSAACFYYPFTLFMRSNFFFINRIFKNDLISDCLCALNHVVGPIHKSVEGWGKARQASQQRPLSSCPTRAAAGWRGLGQRGDCPLQPLWHIQSPNSTLSGRGLPINQDLTCSREPFQLMNENKQLHH